MSPTQTPAGGDPSRGRAARVTSAAGERAEPAGVYGRPPRPACAAGIRCARSRGARGGERGDVPAAWGPRGPLPIGRYLPIVVAMSRRKPGTLLPLETEILEVALSMLRSGQATFHGFGLAQSMREQSGSRSLTGHGTLYKALGRLEEFGLLASRWEDAAAAEGRPRRRLYELTRQGVRVAQHVLADHADRATGRFPRVASEPA
jgi:PadR family transcriptional regulator PadR